RRPAARAVALADVVRARRPGSDRPAAGLARRERVVPRDGLCARGGAARIDGCRAAALAVLGGDADRVRGADPARALAEAPGRLGAARGAAHRPRRSEVAGLVDARSDRQAPGRAGEGALPGA